MLLALRSLGWPRAYADGWSDSSVTQDAFAAQSAFAGALADTAVSADMISASLAIAAALGDTSASSDAFAGQLHVTMSLADMAVTSDAWSPYLEIGRLPSGRLFALLDDKRRIVLPRDIRVVSIAADARLVVISVDEVVMTYSPDFNPDPIPVGSMFTTDSDVFNFDCTANMTARGDTIASVGTPLIQRDDGAVLTAADISAAAPAVVVGGLQFTCLITANGACANYNVGFPMTLTSGGKITRWISLRTVSLLG